MQLERFWHCLCKIMNLTVEAAHTIIENYDLDLRTTTIHLHRCMASRSNRLGDAYQIMIDLGKQCFFGNVALVSIPAALRPSPLSGRDALTHVHGRLQNTCTALRGSISSRDVSHPEQIRIAMCLSARLDPSLGRLTKPRKIQYPCRQLLKA